MSKEQLQDIVEELDGVQCEISISREFFEIIAQETDPRPTPEQTEYAYNRLRVLNAVYSDRIRIEQKRLEEIFNKLHKATA